MSSSLDAFYKPHGLFPVLPSPRPCPPPPCPLHPPPQPGEPQDGWGPPGTSDMEWPSLPARPSAPCPGAPQGVALPGARWGALCPFWIFHFFFFSRTSSSVHPNKRMFPIPLASLLRLPRLEDGARLTPKVHPGLGMGRPVWPWARGMALVEWASSRFRLPVQASSRSQAGVGKRAQRHPAGAPGGAMWEGRCGHLAGVGTGSPGVRGSQRTGFPTLR